MNGFKIFLIVGVALSMTLLGCPSARADVTINGAGATFPYPLYSRWAYEYNSLTGVKMNYQSIGSGGGIAQIKAGTVDFGASDAPLTAEELDESGLVQFPAVIGGVVPVVNIEGVKPGQLKLSADLLAGIFLGKITKWNDPQIAAENTGLELPGGEITVVHRADGSGTTWIFTNYLSKVSPAWEGKVGTGKAVDWPVGVGGKGNEGVAAYVQRVRGSIGYVEYAYALQNNMSHTMLKNQAGKYVGPSISTFQSAAKNADWEGARGYYMVLTDQPGDDSWPITGASFILMRKNPQHPENSLEVLKFMDWCFRHGENTAEKLHYVPIPMEVVEMVEKSWAKEIKANGKAIWPPSK